MKKHYTPLHLIKIIKKHLPRSFNKVLEPSSGNGALLGVIANKKKVDVTAVDIKMTGLLEIQGDYKELRLINSCFLKWKSRTNFDLILMNPPFSGKKSTWVDYNGAKVPIEIAFFNKAIEACSNNGTIIAILPKSIICGGSKVSCDARENLFHHMNIKYVYELSEYEFPSIESQFYLLVAQKNAKQSRIILRNLKDLEISISKSFARSLGYRLDYGFIRSSKVIDNVLSDSAFKYSKLNAVSTIYRGGLAPPYIKSKVLHTTSYRTHWNTGTSTIYNNKVNSVFTEYGDILVKRVGRNCAHSFGLNSLKQKQVPTDCVLIIRPNNIAESIAILFAIRVLYANEIGANKLQNGTGAQYITAAQLALIDIPSNLHLLHRDKFIEYKKATLENDGITTLNIESELQEYLFEKVARTIKDISLDFGSTARL